MGGRRLCARGDTAPAGAERGRRSRPLVTELRSRHAQGGLMIGIDGETGKLVDMKEAGILDSFAVKQQVMRASIETAAMLLRIDQIVSGISHGKKAKMGEQQQQAAKKDDDEDEEIKPLQQLKR